MGAVTAGHNKCDALELGILLYIYCKSWDPRGVLCPWDCQSTLEMALEVSVGLQECHQHGAVPTVTQPLPPGDFGSFSMELSQFWWNHRLDVWALCCWSHSRISW